MVATCLIKRKSAKLEQTQCRSVRIITAIVCFHQQVLRGCGLRTNVTPESFLEAASYIEAKGVQVFGGQAAQQGR